MVGRQDGRYVRTYVHTYIFSGIFVIIIIDISAIHYTSTYRTGLTEGVVIAATGDRDLLPP